MVPPGRTLERSGPKASPPSNVDGLAKVGRRSGSDVSEFSDVNQMLKVSYNKTPGVKSIVHKIRQ